MKISRYKNIVGNDIIIYKKLCIYILYDIPTNPVIFYFFFFLHFDRFVYYIIY